MCDPALTQKAGKQHREFISPGGRPYSYEPTIFLLLPEQLELPLATDGMIIDASDSARKTADALLLVKTWPPSTPGLRKLLTSQHRSPKSGDQTQI